MRKPLSRSTKLLLIPINKANYTNTIMPQQYSSELPARGPASYTGLEIFNFQTSTHFQINETNSRRPPKFTNMEARESYMQRYRQSLASKCSKESDKPQPFTIYRNCTTKVWYAAFEANSREEAILCFVEGSNGKVNGIQYGESFKECLRFIRNYFAHANHHQSRFGMMTDAQKGAKMYDYFGNAINMCFGWYEDAREIRRLNHLRID